MFLHTPARLLALFILASATVHSFGQATAPSHPFTMIRGYVKDAQTHAGIARAIVTLERETSGYVGQAETDDQGRFTFNAPGQETFRITVRPTGYEGDTKKVDLRVSSSDYVTFELRRSEKASAQVAPDELGPRDASIPDNAWNEYVKGHDAFIGHKDVEGGIKHLQKAIKIYPSFSAAYAMLGVAYIAQNDFNGAREALGKSIELNPKLAQPRFSLGMLQNHEKDFVGAEKNLTAGLEINPNAPEAQYELSKSYFALQRYPDAEIHAQKAVELRPDMAPAHVVLGNIALRKGDNQKAASEFKEYLRLDPNGPMSAGVKQMMSRLEQGNQPAPQK
jgi:cytochrome c-type biogenesis protein CcmH/NrfG